MINDKAIQAFRRLTTGVSIVSAGNKSSRYAMTASSVTSVSMQPPSLLVCINKEAEIIEFLSSHNQLCINLLQQSQQDISNTCATPGSGEQRFETGEWSTTATHIPFLQNSQANIFCEIDKRINYATHNIYIAKVVDVKYLERIKPLVYLNSEYQQLSD